MRRTIQVALGENARRLGTLRFDAQGARETAAFEYDAAWPAAMDSFAIDPSLPLVAGPQFHRKERGGSVFHGAIADTEPDGWARRVILRDHAKRRQEARRAGADVESRPLNALDFLLAALAAARRRAAGRRRHDADQRCHRSRRRTRARKAPSHTRSIVWEHGGEINLGNRKGGGLSVRLMLPSGPGLSPPHLPTNEPNRHASGFHAGAEGD